MKTKHVIITIALLSLANFKSNAQYVRTFDVWGYEFGANKNIMNNSFYYGQRLHIGNRVKFNFGFGFKGSFTRLNIDSIPSLNNDNSQKLSLLKNTRNFFINSPISATIGFAGFEFGVSTDLIGYSFSKNTSATGFNLNPEMPKTDNSINPKGFNWLLAKKQNRRNLVTQIFGAYTINDTFTFKVGMASQDFFFALNSTDADNITSETNRFGDKLFYPFISLRLNNEK